MQEFVQFLREFGFPTFFCAWLMWRTEKRLDVIRDLLNKQLTSIAVIAKTIDVEEGAIWAGSPNHLKDKGDK